MRSGIVWQHEGEHAALAHGALHGDVAAVRLGDPARDSQPQPRAATPSCARLVQAVEPLEDALQILGRNARPRIAHGQPRPCAVHVERELNAPARRRVGDGVVNKVQQQLLEQVTVTPRPYLVTHTRPLIPTSHDNGFPSDHTLLAAALTASLWWIDRRWLGAFALGTLLVLVGRLGVGAHHTGVSAYPPEKVQLAVSVAEVIKR